MSAVSSIHSKVLRALLVRMSMKPKKTLVPAPAQPPTETVIDFAPPRALAQTSIVLTGRRPDRNERQLLKPQKPHNPLKNANARPHL